MNGTRIQAPRYLSESREFFAFFKPSFLHSISGGKSGAEGMDAWIAKQYPELASLPDSGLLSRLDYETSGLILAARYEEAFEQALVLGKENSIEKVYLALVQGETLERGVVSGFLGSRYRRGAKVSFAPETRKPSQRSQRASLQWRKILGTSTFSLLEVSFYQGRRHQVRAMLAAQGTPLLGDHLYGATSSFFPMPEKQGFALHSLGVKICREGNTLFSAYCPPPSTWLSFMKQQQATLEAFLQLRSQELSFGVLPGPHLEAPGYQD